MYHSVPTNGQAESGTTRRPQRWTVHYVIDLVSQEKCIPIHLLTHVTRGRANAAHARQLAMYLAHVVLGESLADVGAAFQRNRTTVSYACGIIEDLRDDPQFDRAVQALEQRIEQHGLAHHE